VTADALAFGSLLLVGGRIGVMFSPKRVFITGLIGFVIASAIGGTAVSFLMLAAARALQDAFGAILAPAALGISSILALPRLGPRVLIASGMLLGTGGMTYLTQLTATSGYASGVLPAMLVMGLGFGMIFAPAINTATGGVRRQDSGVSTRRWRGCSRITA